MIRIIICLIYLSLAISTSSVTYVYAKETKELEKCISESKADEGGRNCLEELQKTYFQSHKYSDLADLLKNISPSDKEMLPDINYTIALTRYQQLKYLEESKSWDEYFSKGNDYREDIVKGAEKALSASGEGDAVRVYSRILLYRFHKDQQDVFTEESLDNLMSSALEYSELNKNMVPLKDTADLLLAYDEKGKAKELYRIYAKELLASDIKDEALKDAAEGFYRSGNLELAENMYDAYLERVSKKLAKDKFIEELKKVALLFAYKDLGNKDMSYAETIFKKIEDVGGTEVFDEELTYLRGFNLEKNKEYRKARDVYILLLQKYPSSKHTDELTYKIGIISTYVFRDLNAGRDYFGKLDDAKSSLSYSLAGLYQLGLLKQWEGDPATAKGYYMKLIEKSEGKPSDTLKMAQDRLKEIEGGSGIEHNLKTFMDMALKDPNAHFDSGKTEIKSNVYYPKPGEEADIKSSVYLASSGCFNVELQYLWSGNLGSVKPDTKESGFSAKYDDSGTKMVGLVLVSPSGFTDYTFDLIDVR